MEQQPVLESELIRLRPINADDFEALFAISSDPLLWEQHPSKERAEEEGFRVWFADAMEAGALVVQDVATGRVIGTSRYDCYDADTSEVEIGWTFLDRSLWGGPYNAEMKRLMLDHTFRSVETVLFRVSSENLRSQKAVEKLGATRVGIESDKFGRGDNVLYHLLRSERRRSRRR